ncbi:heavy metal translocating P-type ATPase [Clostridium sp. DJ247]|uniref:heavy metal translocating P-type ATPase n=1 Tax=Clostridium sp. DJ247 TaxID=2726188 RepID=UPI001627194C|nr:heavy metal translocating P-type ATPase [Clostridium sp. DJ247]MBC2581625.1 cadmium-translocating P-type ATPase [Clostridium sp. DJ247]
MPDKIKKVQVLNANKLKVPEKNIKKEFILHGLGCANCAAKMEKKVSELEGVSNVSVNFLTKTLAMEINDLSKVEELIAAAKKTVNNIESHVEVREKEQGALLKRDILLEGLCCGNCAAKIEREVNNLSEVTNAHINFVSKKLSIEFSNKNYESDIIEEVKKIVSRIEPGVKVLVSKENNIKEASHHDYHHDHGSENKKEEIIRLAIGAAVFAIATIFKFSSGIEFILYLISYILVGGEVILRALKNIARGQVFDENFLMAIATVGAFSIKQFPEGVAVMLFYQIGELFQNVAVDRSRKSISELMNIRPNFANLKIHNEIKKVYPEDVTVGDFIVVKPGEKVPLDSVVVEGKSMMDTSALTGESVPREAVVGDTILGGFINKNGLLTVKVTKEFGESTVAKILDLVENASSKKAPTESFITKFARYYTPVVVISAAVLAFIPPLFITGASFSQWIYRALVFLVVSCPCALVISIPLGFFGGIGGASRNGILVKGGNYLEALNDVDTVVFDKTGTLTKGIFKVTAIKPENGLTEDDLLEYAAFAECYSNHPIANSILKAYGKEINRNEIEIYEEISGQGIKIETKGKQVLVGNIKLLKGEGIEFRQVEAVGTVVYLAVDNKFAGYIVISDEIKEDAAKAIKDLKLSGVFKTVMLTGDNEKVASKVGIALGIDEVYSELLPDQKVEKLEAIEKQKTSKGKLVFVGDGINDAPVLARADIGIAMGGVGSDAAIEAADVVIMTDEPWKIVSAIRIAKKTKSIVMQNIVFALGIKVIILILGAFGVATMWEAVFGDVGVAVIAILNAMRAMKVDKL